MRKDWDRRLRKLEVADEEQFDCIGILYSKKAPGMDRALAENERWVQDWHVDPKGHIREVRRRITADLSDCGRNYRRDEMGNEAEDPRLERRTSKAGILWVAMKPGAEPPLNAPQHSVAGENTSKGGQSSPF